MLNASNQTHAPPDSGSRSVIKKNLPSPNDITGRNVIRAAGGGGPKSERAKHLGPPKLVPKGAVACPITSKKLQAIT
jgi:hypothetical protein